MRKLPLEAQRHILGAIESLTGDWRGLNVKRMEGRPEWRLKAPPYRVPFLRDDDLITIVDAGWRTDVYR